MDEWNAKWYGIKILISNECCFKWMYVYSIMDNMEPLIQHINVIMNYKNGRIVTFYCDEKNRVYHDYFNALNFVANMDIFTLQQSNDIKHEHGFAEFNMNITMDDLLFIIEQSIVKPFTLYCKKSHGSNEYREISGGLHLQEHNAFINNRMQNILLLTIYEHHTEFIDYKKEICTKLAECVLLDCFLVKLLMRF
jgi:hypothetical protein